MLPILPILGQFIAGVVKKRLLAEGVELLVGQTKKVKKMKGWKTVAVNALAIAGILAAHFGWDFDPGVWEPVVLGVVNFGLRFVTTTPVGVK